MTKKPAENGPLPEEPLDQNLLHRIAEMSDPFWEMAEAAPQCPEPKRLRPLYKKALKSFLSDPDKALPKRHLQVLTFMSQWYQKQLPQHLRWGQKYLQSKEHRSTRVAIVVILGLLGAIRHFQSQPAPQTSQEIRKEAVPIEKRDRVAETHSRIQSFERELNAAKDQFSSEQWGLVQQILQALKESEFSHPDEGVHISTLLRRDGDKIILHPYFSAQIPYDFYYLVGACLPENSEEELANSTGGIILNLLNEGILDDAYSRGIEAKGAYYMLTPPEVSSRWVEKSVEAYYRILSARESR